MPTRAQESFNVRENAAKAEEFLPPVQTPNTDETRYLNRIGNFSKGLPHDALGEVDPVAYQKLLDAIQSRAPAKFDGIPIGGNTLLVDPQAGLAFDLEGTDSHQLAIAAAPELASPRRAAEAVEVYWQALLRDVSFSQYGKEPISMAAISELNNLTDLGVPSKVTAENLFRGETAGDIIGPYVSQFLYFPLQYGAAQVLQRFTTDLPADNGGKDYLTEFPEWLKAQNGQGPFGTPLSDPVPRYIRNGRDIGAYVHVDVLFEAYFNACIWLVDNKVPYNSGNPYKKSKNQTGFGTFGTPHIKSLVAEVATRALKAVWYQKWFVHRCLRPEAFGSLVHLTLKNAKNYPLHSDVLNSKAVQGVFSKNGTYLLPHAFPEGCPQHPSYAQGHATVAGACATIVKAYFDENYPIPNPVMPSDDGLTLVPYNGPTLRLGNEMNKLAANIAIGRDHAGVHFRSDYRCGLQLGEDIAISILRDQKPCYNENFEGFTFTNFKGKIVIV